MKKSLSDTFRMKDLGNLQYCLGSTFIQTKDSISLSQKQEASEKYGLSEATTVSTPNVKLLLDDGHSKKVNPVQY